MSSELTPFSVQVKTSNETKTYKAHAANDGSLFGALVRLKYSNQGFNFAYIANDDYGPYLQSVNGLQGDSSHYWQLLSGKTPLTVGMGSYFPKKDEVITLGYTKQQK